MFKCVMPIVLVATSIGASAQTVPEGIHSDADGPSTMCGVTGRDANELMSIVRASKKFMPQKLESTRFEVFQNRKRTMQWVFTRPSESAYPAVTCRELYTNSESGTSQRRNMRCDGTREACDQLFSEFQSLDDAMIRAVRGSP